MKNLWRIENSWILEKWEKCSLVSNKNYPQPKELQGDLISFDEIEQNVESKTRCGMNQDIKQFAKIEL